MQIIRGHYNLKAANRPSCATIGNFDGVHLGHQRVLKHLTEQAKALALPSTVILFEPQPREFFQGYELCSRLTRLRDKMQLIAAQGIDSVLCLHFNEAFAKLSAEDFIQQILIEGLGVQYLLAGEDFQFGSKRQGNLALLQQQDFTVEAMPTVEMNNQRVSSTAVRDLLQQGDLQQAEKLLGRNYAITGRVVVGDKLGRQLGVPTANIKLAPTKPSLSGVYCVRVSGFDGNIYPAVANVGKRPTVDGENCRLEVHLLDFKGDLYGKHLTVEFLKKIRDEKKFASLDLLKQQIHRDVQTATEMSMS